MGYDKEEIKSLIDKINTNWSHEASGIKAIAMMIYNYLEDDELGLGEHGN